MPKINITKVIFPIILFVLLSTSCRKITVKETIKIDDKIATLNGTFSEILFGLGLDTNIVAVDSSSNYPDSAMMKPNLGNSKDLNVEKIISFSPNRIFSFKNNVNTEVITQLNSANIQTNLYPELKSIEATKNLIKALADTFHRQEEGMALINQIDEDLKDVKIYDVKPKVLFVDASNPDAMMIAGKNTAIFSMIELAGGKNIAADFEDYKLLTSADLASLNPDAILMFTNDLEKMGGIEAIKKIPGIETTQAGKNNAIIDMEEQFLAGFGVRVGRAVVKLNKKFYTVEIGKP